MNTYFVNAFCFVSGVLLPISMFVFALNCGILGARR